MRDSRIVKVAMRRDPDAPIGQPAPLYIVCPCSTERIPIDPPNGPDVECPHCHTRFSSEGWVK